MFENHKQGQNKGTGSSQLTVLHGPRNGRVGEQEDTCQRNVPVAGVQDFEDHFYFLLFRSSFVILVIHQGPRVDVCPRASPKVLALEEEAGGWVTAGVWD